MSLRAASSLGKCPFVLIALRSCRLSASIAFVVYTTRRSSGGKARNGVTYSQAFNHACVITGKRDPHLSSKATARAAPDRDPWPGLPARPGGAGRLGARGPPRQPLGKAHARLRADRS